MIFSSNEAKGYLVPTKLRNCKFVDEKNAKESFLFLLPTEEIFLSW